MKIEGPIVALVELRRGGSFAADVGAGGGVGAEAVIGRGAGVGSG
jgi:hypothetical protein